MQNKPRLFVQNLQFRDGRPLAAVDSDQWSVVRRIPKQFRERGNGKRMQSAKCRMQN